MQMLVPCKPYPFGNEYHTIVCAKSKVIYNVDIVEGKDWPRVMGKKEFEEKEYMDGLMVIKTKKLWGTGKVVVMNIGFYVLERLISMVEKGVLELALIKKWRYWLKGVTADEIIWHMQKKEVGYVETFQGSIIGKSYHIMDIKDPNYVVITYGTLEHLEGSDTQQRYKVAGGELVTKRFNYREVFKNHFNYRHQFEDIKIGAILLFKLRGIWIKILARPVSWLIFEIDRGQCKLLTRVPGCQSWCGSSVGFLAPVGMGYGWEHTWWIDRGWGGVNWR